MQIGFKHWQQIHKAGCFVNIFPIVCFVMLREVTDRDTKQMSEMEVCAGAVLQDFLLSPMQQLNTGKKHHPLGQLNI